MARNQAAKKAAKANKRKAVVAEKRRAEAASGSRPGQVREGAALPILRCTVSEGVWQAGMGTVILSRGLTKDHQFVATFMVDTLALGVKDLFFRVMDRKDAGRMDELLEMTDPGIPTEPAEARKLLQDLVRWAGANGFQAPRLFETVEKLFGSTVPSDTDYTPRFGHDGKPTYVPGPSETPAEIRKRLAIVRQRFGEEAAEEAALSLVGNLLADAFEDSPEDDDDPMLEHDPVPAEDELVS